MTKPVTKRIKVHGPDAGTLVEVTATVIELEDGRKQLEFVCPRTNTKKRNWDRGSAPKVRPQEVAPGAELPPADTAAAETEE